MNPENHNLALREAVLNNDTETIKYIAEHALKTTTILDLVKETKNYTLLSFFGPFLTGLTFQQYAPLFVDAIRDGKVKELEKYLPVRPNAANVSYHCGLQGMDFELIPKCYKTHTYYLEGVIGGDHLEIFKKSNKGIFHLHYMGQVCAKQIMTYCLHKEHAVLAFLLGALEANNMNTLIFLCAYPVEFKEAFLKRLRDSYNRQNKDLLLYCLREKLIVFSDADWQLVKEKAHWFYQLAQSDV